MQEDPSRFVAELKRAKCIDGHANCLCSTSRPKLVVRALGAGFILAGALAQYRQRAQRSLLSADGVKRLLERAFKAAVQMDKDVGVIYKMIDGVYHARDCNAAGQAIEQAEKDLTAKGTDSLALGIAQLARASYDRAHKLPPTECDRSLHFIQMDISGGAAGLGFFSTFAKTP